MIAAGATTRARGRRATSCRTGWAGSTRSTTRGCCGRASRSAAALAVAVRRVDVSPRERRRCRAGRACVLGGAAADGVRRGDRVFSRAAQAGRSADRHRVARRGAGRREPEHGRRGRNGRRRGGRHAQRRGVERAGRRAACSTSCASSTTCRCGRSTPTGAASASGTASKAATGWSRLPAPPTADRRRRINRSDFRPRAARAAGRRDAAGRCAGGGAGRPGRRAARRACSC